MRKQGVSEKEIAKVFYAIQVGQALHADQLADLWMVHGGIKHNPEAFSFMIEDLNNSMSTIRDSLAELAKKYGVSEYEMYQAGNAAFVSQRSKDLIKRNNKLKPKIKSLLAQGKEKAAKDIVDKHYKLVHQTPEQIKYGLTFFDKVPELKKIQKIWNIKIGRAHV